MSIEIISEKKTQVGQVTVTFTVGRIVSQAKETKGKAGMAVGQPHVRRNNRRSGFQVGEASADLPATSEFTDATAGETALNSPAVAETDANAPDDARLVSGATLSPTKKLPESGER